MHDVVDFDDLYGILLSEYNLTKSYHLLIQERNILRQGKRDVREYTRRFNLLHRDIKRALDLMPTLSSAEKRAALRVEDMTALDVYIQNLKDELENSIQKGRQ